MKSNEHIIYLYINNKRGLKWPLFYSVFLNSSFDDTIIIVKCPDYYFIAK